MYTAIKGIYENGKLTLLEPAPDVEKAEVLVTFLNEEKPLSTGRRVAGGLLPLKHLVDKKITIPPDFNEPLDDFING